MFIQASGRGVSQQRYSNKTSLCKRRRNLHNWYLAFFVVVEWKKNPPFYPQSGGNLILCDFIWHTGRLTTGDSTFAQKVSGWRDVTEIRSWRVSLPSLAGSAISLPMAVENKIVASPLCFPLLQQKSERNNLRGGNHLHASTEGNRKGGGWRDGSAFESTDCSSRGPAGFRFSHPHGHSQPFWASIPGESNILFWPVWMLIHMHGAKYS